VASADLRVRPWPNTQEFGEVRTFTPFQISSQDVVMNSALFREHTWSFWFATTSPLIGVLAGFILAWLLGNF
jgi:ABC-type Fe3+ transport system permease subunit